MSLTLETSRERVELLKAGITGKKIEELYIKCNNFKFANMSGSILKESDLQFVISVWQRKLKAR